MTVDEFYGLSLWVTSTIFVWLVIAYFVRWMWHKGVPAIARGVQAWWRAPLDRP